MESGTPPLSTRFYKGETQNKTLCDWEASPSSLSGSLKLWGLSPPWCMDHGDLTQKLPPTESCECEYECFPHFPPPLQKTSVRFEYVTVTVKWSRDSDMMWEAFCCHGLGLTCPLLKGRVATIQKTVVLHAPIRRAGEITVWFNENEHGSTVLFTTINSNSTEWGDILWKNGAAPTVPCVAFPWNSSPACMLAAELKR